MKKITAVVLACLMLLSVIPTLSVSAAYNADSVNTQNSVRDELKEFVDLYQSGGYYAPGSYYTQKSMDALTEAVENAAEVLKNSNASEAELKDALDEIRTAESMLIRVDEVDWKSELSALLAFHSMNFEQSKEYYYSIYTKESYDAYYDAYMAAQDALMSEPGMVYWEYYFSMEDAYLNLEEAYKSLKKIGETDPTASSTPQEQSEEQAREELKKTVEMVKTGIPVGGAWTDESWNAFIEALNNAKNMLKDDNATAEQLTKAKDELLKAFDNLEPFNGDKTELWSLIEKLDKIILNNDVNSLPNYQELKDLLDAARAAYYYAGSQEELDEYRDKLKDALSALEVIDPTCSTAESSSQQSDDTAQAKEALARAIEKARKELPVGGAWTNESWKAYSDALANAEKLYADGNATAEQLTKAKDELLKAFDNLEPFNGDKTELWSLIEKLDKIILNNDVNSLPNYQELKNLLNAARTAYYYAGSQEELDEYRDKLKAALSALEESKSTEPTESVSTNTNPAAVTQPTTSAESDSTEPTESNITESTVPSSAKTDRELLVERTKKTENPYTIYELGEVSEGYKLYYQLDFNPPWEKMFDVVFGKYVFTQSLSEHEAALGLYIIGNNTVLNLSEAFNSGVTNIDKVVELIGLNDDVPFHFTVSVKSSGEPNLDCYVIGELKDGYRLYYNNIPPPTWMKFFDVVYGKYTFTSCNGSGEEALGLFVGKGEEKIMLSEAIEKGITDPDAAVELIKSRKDIPYNFSIINMDDVNAQLEKRYNGRKFNLVDLGSVYSTYRLYYNVPEMIVTCAFRFEYGGYTFTESGGQVGSDIPEDLGLYVVGNGEVFNLEEASKNSNFKMDNIVALIKAKDIDYTFTVEKTEEKPLKEKFIDYLNEIYKDKVDENYLKDYAELGNIGYQDDILVYGYHLEQPIEGSSVKIGEYTVWSPATDYTTGAGLYVYSDGKFSKLEDVKEKYSAGDILDLIKNAPAEHKFKITSSTAAQLIEERYGDQFRNIVDLGEVAEGYDLYYNIPEEVCTWMIEFEYGNYIFRETGGQVGNVTPEDLGLLIVGDGKVYNLGEAYDGKIVDIEKVVELINTNPQSYTFNIVKKESSVTQPDVTTPDKPDNTPLGKYKKYLADNYNEGRKPDDKLYTANDFEVDVFKKLTGGLYLVHYDHETSTCAMIYHNIDKYLYVASGSGYEAYIYDPNKGKEYKIYEAYEKDIITKKHLKTISDTLSKVKYVAKLTENVIALNAGETYGEFHLSADSKGEKIKNSDPKVAKLVKDKYKLTDLAAMSKGTTKLSIKLKNGKQISCKVIVKNNPKLTRNGKKVKSVTVKKGGKVKVKISGKVKSINNKYTSTKYAKITSKKTAETITVKGLKRGKTTLKIYVNGKKLSLNVKVK